MKASRLQQLAGLGALGVCVALLALYAFVVFLALPGGIDRTESAIAIIAVGLIFALLIATHVVYGRVLLLAARGKRWSA